MKTTILCCLGVAFILLAGCTTTAPITLPAPPPCRYEATTDPVGCVNGQLVTITL